jgi:signal transduction histidine kinase
MVGILSKMHTILKQHADYSAPFMIPFGIFGTFNYPIFYFYWVYFGDTPVTDLYFRLIATFLCLLLALKNKWPITLEKLTPYIWYGTVIFCLPFLVSYNFLQNPFSNSWTVNIILALFWLILVLDLRSFIFTLVIGMITAAILHACQGHPIVIPIEILRDIGVHTIWITATSLFFINRKEITQELKHQALKITALQMQAGSIAHEMRTPLAAAGLIADGMALNLPILVRNQELAQEKDPSIPHIHPITLEGMAEIPSLLKSITRSAFTVIDMLLMNLKKDVPEEKPEKCSILTCVQTALQEYPLTQTDKGLVISEITQDFEFYGHPVLVKHVFFNLIKNALYYVKAAGKGKITIWTELGDRVNKVHVKDTGKGIPKDYLPHVFDQFFTRTDQGNGIGLAFCKMVMTKVGGDITCNSIEGEFTQFTLTFPTSRQ